MNVNSRRVLVTGATGFIGSACLPILAKTGFEIHGISRQQPASDDSLRIVWHQLDMVQENRRIPALLDLVKPSHLLHLAWCTDRGDYWQSDLNADWLSSSLVLLKAFQRSGGNRTVIAGTCAEYGASLRSDGDRGGAELQPSSMYSECKDGLRKQIEADEQLSFLCRAWARIFFPYGPGEKPTRFIPSVIRALLLNEYAKCTSAEQVRDLIYVDDVAEALVKLLDSSLEGIFNVGTGRPTRLRDVAGEISRQLNKPDFVLFGALPPRVDEPPELVADVSRLSRLLQWSAKVPIERGIAQTIAWWQRFSEKER